MPVNSRVVTRGAGFGGIELSTSIRRRHRGFAQRAIRFVKANLAQALDPCRKVAVPTGGTEMPYELFLGVPGHHVPPVAVESGLAAGALPVAGCR